MKSIWMFAAIAFFALFSADQAQAGLIPIRDIPHLISLSAYERSGGTAPDKLSATPDSIYLTTRVDDPLTTSNSDFNGFGSEAYDVYYSDADGTFNPYGSFLTITATYQDQLPFGGGLNIAEVQLDFSDRPSEFANVVTAYVALGDNAIPSSVAFAIDGNLQTNTTMGNTVGQTQRLSLTLGFASTSVPEPPTLVMSGMAGLLGLGLIRYRRRVTA